MPSVLLHLHVAILTCPPLTHECLRSINAFGVDIQPLSAIPGEEEVLLLPGIPLVNLTGENPEEDLWTFELEIPRRAAMVIDYVHPGT